MFHFITKSFAIECRLQDILVHVPILTGVYHYYYVPFTCITKAALVNAYYKIF